MEAGGVEAKREREMGRRGKAAIILCHWREQRPGGGEQNWKGKEERERELEKRERMKGRELKREIKAGKAF